MKTIVAQLNKQMNPLTRTGAKPAFTAIPESEITKEKIFITSPKTSEKIQPEVEEAKRFTRHVNQAAKSLWLKTMKAGAKGLLKERLLQELELEDYPPSIVKAALDKLEEANQIYETSRGCIASVASMSPLKEEENKNLYEVEIEKILSGRAICIINNKWRARLIPEEYEGPPNLIRTNMRFKTKGRLYHEGKTLCIQVQRVTKIL
jgi:hypothetical protein